MSRKLNQLLDILSNYFAHRKGLLPLLGIALVIGNFFIQFFHMGWFSESDILLHFGVIVSIFGLILAWAL
jgi:hypothetical protein